MAASRRTLLGLGVLVVVLAAAGFAGWWFLIRDDAPPRADIDEASETLGESGGEPAASDEDVEGTWTVDTSVGSFDDFSSTWAGYRIQEELASIGGTEAAGRTPDVSGTMTVAGGEVTAVDVEIDTTTLRSDESRRDNQLRTRGLQTDQFPTASFRLTEPLALPEGIESGERVSATATGELTLHGQTNDVTVEVEAELTGERAVVVGSAPVVLADFGIEPPTGGPVLGVADQGEFEFQVFFSKG